MSFSLGYFFLNHLFIYRDYFYSSASGPSWHSRERRGRFPHKADKRYDAEVADFLSVPTRVKSTTPKEIIGLIWVYVRREVFMKPVKACKRAIRLDELQISDHTKSVHRLVLVPSGTHGDL